MVEKKESETKNSIKSAEVNTPSSLSNCPKALAFQTLLKKSRLQEEHYIATWRIQEYEILPIYQTTDGVVESIDNNSLIMSIF